MGSRAYRAAPAPQGSLSIGLFGALIGLVVFLIIVAWKALKTTLKVLFMPLPKFSRCRAKDVTELDQVASRAAADPDTVSNVTGVVMADRLALRSVGEDAKLHCRLYRDRQEIDAIVLSVSEKALKVFGRRHLIEVFDAKRFGLEEAADQALRKAIWMIEKEEVAKVSEAPGPAAAATPLPEENEQRANEAFSEGEEKRSNEHTNPVSRASRKRVVRYRGALVGSGFKVHTSGQYESFSVTLDDEELGGTQDLWGADLQRALTESGARIGDRIELAIVGVSPTVVRGKATKKKIWSVTKI